jgi:energy-coupling factor transport system ATP-binding protein
VRQAAAFVGLDESVFDHSPLELSGGQKRRVAIAGVLAMEPELLILDEPSAGLDPAGREDLLENLFQWRKARQATILLVTHDMSAAALCDQVVVMNQGRKVLQGTPGEVFAHAQQLQQMGLDLPEAAHIALLLRQQGVNVPQGIYTTQQLKQAILALWKGGAPC